MKTNFEGNRFRGWVHPEASLNDLVQVPERLERQPDARLFLRRSGRHIYQLEVSYKGHQVPCIAYYAFGASWGHGSARSSAKRVLHFSQLLPKEGFHTVPVLAVVWRRGFLSRDEGLVVMREVAEVGELESAGRHRSQTHSQIAWEEPIAQRLAVTLARLHNQKLFHGDLKSRHILIRSATEEFVFVDLEKMRQPQLGPRLLFDVLAARDLIQLFSSLTTGQNHDARLRESFLAVYLDDRNLNRKRRRRLHSLVGLYGPRGNFRQGDTVFRNLIGLLRGKRD